MSSSDHVPYVTQPLELVLTEIVDDGIGHASKGGNGKVWDPRHSSVFAPRCQLADGKDIFDLVR